MRSLLGTARLPAIVLALALGLTACGTRVDKAAYYRSLAGSGVLAEGNGSGPAGQGPAFAPATGGPAGEAPLSVAQPSSAPSAAPLRASTVEVGDTVSIGIHVPITGAAPMPMNFLDSLQTVEEYVNAEARPYGRAIKLLVEDDGYDPGKGLAACKKLTGENVLLALGVSQPAIHDVCATQFGKLGIPYLPRGTEMEIIRNRSLVYFFTAAQATQASLLADYIMSRLGGTTKKVGFVFENDVRDTAQAFLDRMKARGGRVVVSEQSVPRQADFSATVQKLQQAGAEIVFLDQAPVDVIKLAVQAQAAGYHPTWTGLGTNWNYNMVMEGAKMALDGAINFSPWAAVDSAGAAEWRRIYAKYRPDKEPDDLGMVAFGVIMLVRSVLMQAGPHLTRAALLDALNNFRFSSPYFNPVQWTATDHLGPREVAVFRGDGQAQRWVQISGFTGSF